MRSEVPNSLLMRAAVPRSTTHWRAACTLRTVRSFCLAKRRIATIAGAKAAARWRASARRVVGRASAARSAALPGAWTSGSGSFRQIPTTTGSSGATLPTAFAPSGWARWLPASAIFRRRGAAPMLLPDAAARLRRRHRIVDRAEGNRPDEIGRRTGARQAGHAFENGRARVEAPIPDGIDRSERRKRAVETGVAGGVSVTVPACAAVTGHAGRAVDEALFGDGVSDPDVETGIVDLVGLRSLEAIIHVGGIPFRGIDHGRQRRGLCAGRIAAARLPVGRHVRLRGAERVLAAQDIAARGIELVLEGRPGPVG